MGRRNDVSWDKAPKSHETEAKKGSETNMPRQSIFDMNVSKVYPLLLQKVERKGSIK